MSRTKQTNFASFLSTTPLLPWSLKKQNPDVLLPSRHCKGAKVYGHTTTATHDNEYTPSAPCCLRYHPFLILRPVSLCRPSSGGVVACFLSGG